VSTQSVAPTAFFEVSVVAFDLDGTLVDTLPDLHTATNLTLNDLGYGAVSPHTVRQYIGQGIEYLLQALFAELNISQATINFDEAAQQFRDHYLRHVCEQSALFPGVASALEGLKRSGLGLACLTNLEKARGLGLFSRGGVWGYVRQKKAGSLAAA
jgi:phosphoglycolate phosphatase